MKINLSEYPTAGKIAARAIVRAAANGTDTIFTSSAGTAPNERSFIRHGRRSWIEFWQQILNKKS